MSIPAGADKKLQEKLEAKKREEENARRKHAWTKSSYEPVYDYSRGTRTEVFQCSRTGCSKMWTRRFSISSGNPIPEGKEPIGCFGK